MIIDPEFATLLPIGTGTENDLLEAELVKDGGPRDPLLVWAGTGILVDGHRRWKIIEKHNLDFTTKEVEFESRDAVVKWMLLHQLSRRSLSDYDRAKKLKELTDMMKGKKEERVAQAAAVVGVSARSVYRMLEVGKIADQVIPQFREYMNCIGRDTLQQLGKKPAEEQLTIYNELEEADLQRGKVAQFMRGKLSMKQPKHNRPHYAKQGVRPAGSVHAACMSKDSKKMVLEDAIKDCQDLIDKLDGLVVNGLIKSGDMRSQTVGAVKGVEVCLKWIKERLDGRQA